MLYLFDYTKRPKSCMNGAFSGLMYINNSLINLIKCRYSEFLFGRLHNKFYCITNRYKVYFRCLANVA